jgi:hypothetical protein
MKVMVAVLVVGLFAGANAAFAQCCAGGAAAACKGHAEAAQACSWSNVCTKVTLTDEQKAQVKAVCEKYCKAEGGEAKHADCMKEMEKILSADQMKQLKAACGRQGGQAGCKAPEKLEEK